MLKRNNIRLAVFSAAAALGALLIFLLLPTSQLANGIEYSGKDALWVLVLSPVLSLAGTVSFISVFVKDGKTWNELLCKPIVSGAIALSGAFGLLNFATYISYTLQQFSLGFVAPYDGTAFEYLAVAATVTVVLNFLCSAFVSIATVRNK